jgi:hypothetical protein
MTNLGWPILLLTGNMTMLDTTVRKRIGFREVGRRP